MARIRGGTIMKILCVDASTVKHRRILTEGQVYEGIPDKNHCGKEAYKIPELYCFTRCNCGHIHEGPIFLAHRFIPISDVDETELVKERNSTIPLYAF